MSPAEIDDGPAAAISRWTGEFVDRARERAFRAERRTEETAHSRLVGLLACIGVIPASLIDYVALGWGMHLAIIVWTRFLVAFVIAMIAAMRPTSEGYLSAAAVAMYASMVAGVWISPTTASVMNFNVANVMIAIEIFLPVRMWKRAAIVGTICATYPVVIPAVGAEASVSPVEMFSILAMMVALGWMMGVALNTSRRVASIAEHDRLRLIEDLELEIERRTELQAQLVHLAEFDGLTGIRNRRSFIETAQAALDAAQADHRHAAVMLIDLDHFKSVNDTFGHARGDAVLRDVARRLRDLETDDVSVGRVGGEEFAVVCVGFDRQAVIGLAERIRASMAPTAIDGASRADVTTSIGVCTEAGADLAAALKCADDALYDAKRAGRDRVSARSLRGSDVAAGVSPVA